MQMDHTDALGIASGAMICAGGRVQVGADADLTVFDPARVIDVATFENPTQYSAGIVHVLVNGTFVVRGEQLVSAVAPGQAVQGRVVRASR
jgi:N-acyl-D-aspartate/D-glutamate deacylase